MPQCIRSSFSKALIAGFVFLGIALCNSAAQSQADSVSQPFLDQQSTGQKPTELDGQISKTIEAMKRAFETLKANESSVATNKNQQPRPVAELANEAAKLYLDPHQALALYSVVLQSGNIRDLQIQLDEARTDKQVSSNSSSPGSTSLTSKGSVPAVLGFAVENGSLERSTSGSAITFRARPIQVIQTLQRTSFDDAYKQIENNQLFTFINRFSFAVTFDTTRGTMPGTFTGNSSQVSSFSTHIDILNNRDPRSSKYHTNWAELQARAGDDLAHSLYDNYDRIFTNPAFVKEFTTWKESAATPLATHLMSGDVQALNTTLREQLKKFYEIATNVPESAPIIKHFADASITMQHARQNILDLVDRSPVLSFEYTDNPAAKASLSNMRLPNSSNFKFIFEEGLKGGSSFTSNFSATMFNSRQHGLAVNQLRDLQGSFQLDIPVNTSFPEIGNVVASLSGKYEHIPHDSFIGTIAGAAPLISNAALKGNLVIGQAKITFPIKGSGIKIPLSITWANRTELIKEKTTRGNIGITFDLDTIMSKLKQ